MLFKELGKLKRSSIMASIILATIGILMIMCPTKYVTTMVALVGNALLIVSVVWILDFLSGKKTMMSYVFLTGAMILAILGIAVLMSDKVVLVFGLVFGLVLVGDGIISLINSWIYARRAQRKYWWVLIILSALMILFGLIVLVNPWWKEPTMLFDVIGGMLLFSSVVSIVRLIFNWPIKVE